MSAAIPRNEAARLVALRELMAADRQAGASLDDLTSLAAHICHAPIALITLLDEEWQHFRSRYGTDLPGTPRAISFCGHAILQPDLMVVPDLTADERFANNPFVTGEPHIRFYAGAPLTTSDGHKLGTICVLDQKARDLTLEQRQALRVLSHHAVTQLELQRSDLRRREAETALQAANAQLERRVEQRTKALREEHTRLELAVGAANIGLWEWNITTDRIEKVIGWAAELGITESERPRTGKEWHALLHPDDLPRLTDALAAYIQHPVGEFESELRLRHKDGSYRWVLLRARAIMGPDGRPEKISGCHIDLTERRLTEDRLRESRERLRELAAHLQTVREEETGRIARELHDELGATLTGLKFDAAWIERQVTRVVSPGEGAMILERLRALEEGLDAMIGSVRKVCQDLRPAILDELGLAVAMEWQVTEFYSHTGVPCRLNKSGELKSDPGSATIVFRVLQELLTNAARHARPTSVEVDVQQDDGSLQLVVADDGCGLPADAWTRRGRFGLVGIRERVLAAGGTVDFQSAPDRGTRVTVRIPRGEQPVAR